MPRSSPLTGRLESDAQGVSASAFAPADGRFSWILTILSVVTVAAIVLRPIAADDFWWQLARGRAVIEGSMAPSRLLLVAETAAEADWLGGLPVYIVYSWFGTGALMVLKVAMAVGCGLLAARQLKQRAGGLWFLTSVALVLLATNDAWDLTPRTFDLVGVVGTWGLTRRWMTRPTAGRASWLIVAAALWANIAPLCVLAPLTFLLAGGVSSQTDHLRRSVDRRWVLTGSIVLACCVTPRHVFTLWDSLRMLVPRIAADAAVLEQTGWRPTLQLIGSVETVAFLGLSVLALGVLILHGARAWRLVAFLATQVIGWSSSMNVAPAAFLVLLLVAEFVESGDYLEVQKRFRSYRILSVAGCVIVVAMITSFGLGRWPGEPSRIGWGIDPRIAPDQFAASLQGITVDGNAHCVGVREAGLMGWFHPDGLQPYDVLHRALLGGRLRDHVLLNHELRTEWRNQHRREDGTWGGWWITLQQRNIRALVVPAEDTELIQALEPTRWKPLSIDACSLVYGFAGDSAFGPRIVATQQLADFLDRGAWTYTPPAPMGAANHFDLSGWWTGRHDMALDIRQARVLQAMNRRIAALRVLRPARNSDLAFVLRDFTEIQRELADQERLTAGAASRFREATVTMAEANLGSPSDSGPLEPALSATVAAYLVGDYATALDLLTTDDAESRYARASVLLEAGDPVQAVELLERLINDFPDEPVTLAARNVFLSLSE